MPIVALVRLNSVSSNVPSTTVTVSLKVMVIGIGVTLVGSVATVVIVAVGAVV